jgi:phosphoribosyl 1,2-cyclic phosphodiesterase
MRFASLGSGSAGNSLLVQHADTCVMIDCGFSIKETETRLARFELQASQIDAILLTHEHQDHAAGVSKLASKYQIPVVMTYGTMRALQRQANKSLEQIQELDLINLIDSHSSFEIADLFIQPFPVPHDAREPVQYTISNDEHKLGVLTDTGCITSHIENCLSDCHALVLECNHDLNMLHQGSYPNSLKNRVGGRWGHLDNQTTAKLLSKIAHAELRIIVAAHLSEQNNAVDLAKQALSQAIQWPEQDILVADQYAGLAWQTL